MLQYVIKVLAICTDSSTKTSTSEIFRLISRLLVEFVLLLEQLRNLKYMHLLRNQATLSGKKHEN